MLEAVKIVRDFRPDVIFTSGGYVAVPAGLAARLNGVPLVMHQQDVSPNLSNRLIGPLAKRISVAFADSLNYFPKQKTLHLGNPVREAILEVAGVSAEQAREKLGFDPALPLILVTGGSQGARHLNQVICETLPELLVYCQVLQISGSKLFEETRSQAEQVLTGQDEAVKARYRVVPYMDAEMALALQASSLVVCRAGAATLSELAVLGKPCLLVPLPPAIGGSPQEVNASMFARKQAAKVLKDGELTRPNLAKSIRSILSSDEALRRMAEATLQLAKPHATEDIAAEVVRIAQRGRIKG
jgi:UDP-N-acetylglucosamine--N-acetylmuramyl-(pentapeptide) pyrophosphoryl-undecaprenol N-acetylglucosamine transferase